MTVQLPGTQTRSFCYVSDLVSHLPSYLLGYLLSHLLSFSRLPAVLWPDRRELLGADFDPVCREMRKPGVRELHDIYKRPAAKFHDAAGTVVMNAWVRSASRPSRDGSISLLGQLRTGDLHSRRVRCQEASN